MLPVHPEKEENYYEEKGIGTGMRSCARHRRARRLRRF